MSDYNARINSTNWKFPVSQNFWVDAKIWQYFIMYIFIIFMNMQIWYSLSIWPSSLSHILNRVTRVLEIANVTFCLSCPPDPPVFPLCGPDEPSLLPVTPRQSLYLSTCLSFGHWRRISSLPMSFPILAFLFWSLMVPFVSLLLFS